MEQLSESLAENQKKLDHLLGVGRNYDVISRDLYIGQWKGRMYVIDGYGDDGVIERITSFLLGRGAQLGEGLRTMQEFIDRCVTFCEVDCEKQIDKILTGAFLGKTILLLEGFDACAMIDAKKFPGRSVEEPSDGKVLRGSHDGFTETLVQNTALLRRRIRDSRLTLENHKVGGRSQTDVVLAYMEDQVNRQDLEKLREKLDAIDVGSISMSQESVAEAIVKPQWYNPFPKVRYTERPDTATACIMEGSLIMLVDNSPSVMLMPTSLFDFMEEANDYYFPPLVGTYLRWLRVTVMLLALFITPVWYLLVKDASRVPEYLSFIVPEEPGSVPLLVQLLLLDFVVDLLKLASLNTPDALSNSFSMLGALILGDFAVQARWMVPEVLVYMAFVAIANFAQPSFELGYALKLTRMTFLILVALFDLWGLILGTLGWIILLASTKPLLGRGYLYPICPFDGKALGRLLIRQPISRKNS
jgi:stage V sporulation protein AF